MQKQLLLAMVAAVMVAGPLAGCSALDSTTNCGPGPETIGSLPGSLDSKNETVQVEGELTAINESRGSIQIDDTTGKANITIFAADLSNESLEAGDCIVSHGTVTSNESEDPVEVFSTNTSVVVYE